MMVKSSRLRLKEFMKNGGTAIRFITVIFFNFFKSNGVFFSIVSHDERGRVPIQGGGRI